MGNYLRMEKR